MKMENLILAVLECSANVRQSQKNIGKLAMLWQKNIYPLKMILQYQHRKKTKHMEVWWALSEEAIKGLKVSPEEINEVCIQLGPSLRDGSKELFDELCAAKVPVLVFSAGLGDTVMSVLKHCDVLLPNVEVVSNFLKYDSDGCIMGFKDRLIHVYNKNEYAIKGTDFYNQIVDRDNVILLGDSIGDASMVEGMDHLKVVLKIGFLYARSEESLPNYMNTFDIVLQDDQTMEVPRAILNYIKNSASHQSELSSN
ncbi:hypothetical protein NQ314_005194 [Rhamnusium bicolor]|uniref:5'-nucleotidase n=1 Tax=Rhamnusium bicolor TaxID=1586634 RepID=A0AAV8ZHP6_9CUCU|nr:hypothetical protein NQ314_005194 [Rhamnusium bicolor]